MSASSPQMKTTPSSGAALRDLLGRLWKGDGKPTLLWRKLIRVIFLLPLAWLAYTVGLMTVRWPLPVNVVGIAMLIVAGGAFVQSMVDLLTVCVRLGIRRLIVRLLILYLVAVLMVGLAFPSTAPRDITFWGSVAMDIAQWPFDGVRSSARTIVSAPEEIHFAITGRRSPILVPGVEWVDGIPPPPIPANKAPTGAEAIDSTPISIIEGDGLVEMVHTVDQPLRVGNTARVVGTEGAALRGREAPAISAKVVVRFPPQSVVHIIDGPRIADGKTWWKVKGEQGEGWCAAEFLAP